jgi:DNA polymerase elongation subunit (family B)
MSVTRENGSELLYGWDDTAGIVAAGSLESGGVQYLRLYRRNDYEAELNHRNGTTDGARSEITTDDRAFSPFLLFADERFAEFLTAGGGEVSRLDGDLDYRFVARFPSMKALERARRGLDERFRGEFKRVSDEYLFVSDAVQQGMLALGVTHFKGMSEDDVVRMQLDIETDTTDGFEFPSAARDADEIIIVAMSDSRGRARVVSRRDMDEAALIAAIGETIREWDPDVIEGHSIFNFDLPYIAARAARHRVKLDWGRDGSLVKSHKSRVNLAERRYDYTKFEVEGRAFVDTYILVQFYDIVKREMESYGLKEVARYLGVAADDRVYIDGSEIRNVWRSDPDRLIEYAQFDVRETRAIAAMLGAPYFYEARMLPIAYQDVFIRGNAMKINGLMLRWYLRNNHSVPKPQSRAFDMAGGYTDVRAFGVIHDVVACDVASLYPSLMLTYKIKPANDRLDAFLEMLGELRTRRLSAKAKLKATTDASVRRTLDNEQATFKILINSFFGYLGADGAYFGDNDAGNRVTTTGQEILKRMISLLELEACRIIEVDTDGVYFKPPRDGMTDAEIEQIVERLTAALPEGITVEVDGRYPAMLSYKTKNYALLRQDGQIIIKGSGLKSRGLEPFLRDFLRRAIRMTLQDRAIEIAPMYDELRSAISDRTMPITELAKTERLQDPLETYKTKISKSSRGRQAGYELAIAAGLDLKPGDYITYYVTGQKKSVPVWKNAKLLKEYDSANPDFNVEYYIGKLDDTYERVKGFEQAGSGTTEDESEARLFEP